MEESSVALKKLWYTQETTGIKKGVRNSLRIKKVSRRKIIKERAERAQGTKPTKLGKGAEIGQKTLHFSSLNSLLLNQSRLNY